MNHEAAWHVSVSVHQVSLVGLRIGLAIADNLIHCHLLLEARVELVHVDRVFLLLRRVHRDIKGGVDGHLASEPVLIVEVVEGDGGDRGVRVALLVRSVRDKRRQVLLKLGQVRRDI